MRIIGIPLLFLSLSVFGAGEMPVTFTMSGKLFESPTSTHPLLEQNIELRVQILNSTKSCVLYDEKQFINTDTTEGGFSVQVGSLVGAGKRVSGSDRGNTMATIFQNTFAIPGTCSGASAPSAPVANGGRYLRLIVKPQGHSEDVLSPDIFIGHVQMALVAETLGGLTKDQFLQLGTGTSELTQTNLETIFSATNFPILEGLVQGSTTTGGISSDGNYVITANADNVGTGVIQLSIGTTVAAEVTNSGNFIANQKIGVGTGVPSFDLSFGGASNRKIGLERNSSGSGSNLVIAPGGAAAGSSNSAGGDLILASGLSTGTAGSNILFQTPTPGGVDNSPVTKMLLDTLGRLGINTTSPDRPLHISSNSGPTILLDYVTAGTDQKRRYITNTADGALAIGKFSDDMNSNTEHLRILSSGNIGVGTSTPASRFHLAVAPTASGNYGLLSLGSAPFDGATGDFFTGHAAGTLIAGNTGSTYTGDLINLQVGGVTKFKVDGDGAITSGGTLTTTGNISQSGSSTLSTGTGNVTMNGATTIAANQNLSMAAGTGTFTQNYTGTGSPASITANSMASGDVLSLTSGSSAVTANQSGLSILLSGANAAGGVTRYGVYSNVTSTGATSTNIGGYFSASGATNNYGLIVSSGNVGIGIAAPVQPLDVNGNARISGTLFINALSRGTSTGVLNLFSDNLSGNGGEIVTHGSAKATDPGIIIFKTGAGSNSERVRIDALGRVGIGTSSPNGMLDVAGPILTRVDSTGTAGLRNNVYWDFVASSWKMATAGYGSAILHSNSNGSMFFSSTSTSAAAGAAASLANRMVIDITGNVGVGISSPTATLDVSGGSVAAVFGADNGAMSRTNSNGKVARIGFAPLTNTDIPTSFLFGQSTATGGTLAIGGGSALMNAANSIDFYTASTKTPSGTSRMVIDSLGRVGIGMTPSTANMPLTLMGTGAQLGLYYDATTSGSIGINSSGHMNFQSSAGVFKFQNGSANIEVNGINNRGAYKIINKAGTTWLDFGTINSTGTENAVDLSNIGTIYTSGNVGVGTSSPNAKLEVQGASGSYTTSLQVDTSSNSYGPTLKGSTSRDSANRIFFQGTLIAKDNQPIIFGNASNFYTTYSPSASKLEISDGSNVFLSFRDQGTKADVDLNQGQVYLLNTGNVGVGTSSPGYKLDVNGDIRIASGSKLFIGGSAVCDSTGCPSPSDRRYKENISPLTNSLDKVLAIQGVEYDWKNKDEFSDRHQIGFIAQDLEKVFPEVVITDEKSGFKSVMYDHLLAPLIEAFKSSYSRILGIEAENKKLKAENASIKAYLCAKDKTAPFCFDR